MLDIVSANHEIPPHQLDTEPPPQPPDIPSAISDPPAVMEENENENENENDTPHISVTMV